MSALSAKFGRAKFFSEEFFPYALASHYSFETEYNSSEGRCDFLAIPKPGSARPAMLVEVCGSEGYNWFGLSF